MIIGSFEVKSQRYFELKMSRSFNTIPALLPFLFDDPSTYKIHVSSSIVVVDNSMMKYARDCAFIIPLESYLIMNSESFIDRATILLASSGFLKTFAIEQSVLTIIL